MKMKKIFALFVIATLFVAQGCKKESITPNASSLINGKVMKVESIKVGEIDISQYLISGFVYNASMPTLFEPKIDGGASLLYKTTDNQQMETAKIVETKNGLLNIQFTDKSPNGIGNQNSIYVPQELLDKQIVTYQQNNCNYCQPYYVCSSEVLNGNYAIEKTNDRFIMTRTEEPVIVITMAIK